MAVPHELAEVGAEQEAHHAVGVEAWAQQSGTRVVADPGDERLIVRAERGPEELGELWVGVAHDGGEAAGAEDVGHLPPGLLQSGADLLAHGPLGGAPPGRRSHAPGRR